MNIRDLGALGGDPYGQTRKTSERDRTENTEQTSGAVENSRTASPQVEEPSARDVFRTSDFRQKIEDLTQTVETAGDEPRTDRVELAQQRVASGYYNSEGFLSSLALRLVNIDVKG